MKSLSLPKGMCVTELDLHVADEHYMRRAIELAQQGEQIGEIPVGAVIVCEGEIIGEGFNQPITSHDPTAHAEVVALRAASQRIQNYRLVDSTLYVTLEPCTMCVGALIHARIARLVFGTTEPKAGAVVSQSQLLDASYFNHRMLMQGGVLAETCQHQLSDFFRRRREELKQQKNSRDNNHSEN
jgi:tRNA(adenine34) deaminase